MITVLYFAAAREATEGQIASEQIALPPSATNTTTADNKISVAELKRTLAKKHGKKLAAILETCAVSVEREYCESDEDLARGGDEVAIIPPISGG
jgi:molybdopterin converting factor small subunit